MKKYIAFCILSLPVVVSTSQINPAFYLKDRIDPLNGRYKTFIEALQLMDEHQVQTIVETGTERWQEEKYCFDGDGGSTIIFANWAEKNNAKMYSVDINETHLKYCDANTRAYASNLELVLSDSVTFLQNFSGSIDFLYLDSYDYDENNPLPAQHHCLKEVLAAENKLVPSSIIMIDDCNIPGGGKGLLAIKYLLSQGWFLHRNYHQVILLRLHSQ